MSVIDGQNGIPVAGLKWARMRSLSQRDKRSAVSTACAAGDLVELAAPQGRVALPGRRQPVRPQCWQGFREGSRRQIRYQEASTKASRRQGKAEETGARGLRHRASFEHSTIFIPGMDGERLIHVPNPAAAKVGTRPGVEQEAREEREELAALTPLALRSFAALG